MPGLIGVNEFIEETREDYNSPTTSTFVKRMGECRQTIATLEETLDLDRECLTKMKKAVKSICSTGNLHVDNELYLARTLERLGDNACEKDQEPDIGAAFLKFAVVHKELSALMKTLMQNVNNIVMFPVDSLLKGDLRGVKGDLKRPFDRAAKDFEAKYAKIEKERKQQAKEAGMIRNELSAAEIADDLEKERRMFQLQMSEYLLKVNDIKTKKSVELLQHLIDYFHVQTNYFQDGLKTIEHFGNYVADLSTRLQTVRQKQDEERRQLNELKQLLIRSAPGLDKEAGHTPDRGTVYSLHQLQGDKQAGMTRTGHLMKKSEGKMRRVWQKRRCCVQAEGFLEISHGDETKPPTKVNLLTCQIKAVPDDKRCFDVLSYNRTYHFQAEDEADQRAWQSVLINCKESALYRAFNNEDKAAGSATTLNPSLLELQQAIIRHIQRLPSNDHCADCNSQNDTTWLSINFGVVVCIECSGIHRDLGVHISRIQSLTLDHIGTSQLLLARYMTNQGFNDVMESNLNMATKPSPSSSMEERYSFIRAKYLEKRFVKKTCSDEHELLSDLEHAVKNNDLSHLLQVFGEGVDLSAPLLSSEYEETALHLAVTRELGISLCIVDFLVQNMRSTGLDKPTSLLSNHGGNNTALHLCAIHDKPECMKLLLRSGADPTLHNGQDKTPLDIAKEKGHHTCEELLRHALDRQKSLFENINIDWNLSHDEGSTDFSDDDTVVDDRNGCVTPERKQPSRPPSYTESPVNMRSRSSTCDSHKSNNYRQPMPPPPPPQNKKPLPPLSTASSAANLKKRAAPLPPSGYGTLPTNHNHNRSPSDPNSINYHTLNHHKRSPSSDSRVIHLAGAKLVIPPGEIPTLKSTGLEKTSSGGIQRPRGPPPPAPNTLPSSRLSNGQSTESISSLMSDIDSSVNNPVPPPRKPYFYCPLEQPASSSVRPPRCKALYDCSADNEDELSFKEGDIILVTSSCTEDENWMEGALERDPTIRGMFPISFVVRLSDS